MSASARRQKTSNSMTVSRAEADPVRRTAWAKINLTLHVTGRRDDGYHELDSLIVFAGLGDGLEIAPGPQISLDIAGPFILEKPWKYYPEGATGFGVKTMVALAERFDEVFS